MKNTNIQTWDCGTENASDVIASLNGTTLTISGEGKMRDFFNSSKVPWYGKNITKIIVNQGVLNIGQLAFLDCMGVTSVSISNTVNNIEYGAFMNCSGLESIEIPNSVVTIGEYAFNKCSGLKTVEMPNSIIKIGEGAFWGCVSLTTITIPESVESLGKNLFYNNANLAYIINRRSTPQIISSETFRKNDKSYHFYNFPLYVPESSLGAYKNAREWSRFSRILPIKEEMLQDESKYEQIDEQILKLETQIDEFKQDIANLEKEIEELQFKKAIMRGEKGNPKDVAQFMSLFNQRDGLKYLTHDFDENGDFDMDSFLAQARKVCTESFDQLEIPKTLKDLLTQFAFEQKSKLTIFNNQYNAKEITNAWSSAEWKETKSNKLHPIRHTQFAEVIKDFRRTTRIESPNLETLINKVFSENTFDIKTMKLSKADFYTHVGEFKAALETIFEEIQKRSNTPDKRQISVEYKRTTDDDFFVSQVIITHHNSYPTKDADILIKEWLSLDKGNMGKIAEHLQGYCHWSVITKIDDKPIKINILREKGTIEQEEIKASEVIGFTHILTFYYQ